MNPASTWTRSEDKEFENSLARYPDGTADRWFLISLHLPGKTPYDVQLHYQALVHDIEAIDSGAVQLPDYDDDCGKFDDDEEDDNSGGRKISFGSKAKREERKRGTPWTEDEHM